MNLRTSLLLATVALGFMGGSIPQKALAENPTAAGFANIVEPIIPSVVNISTSTDNFKHGRGRTQMRQGEMPEFPPGSPFEELFRYFMEEGQGQGMMAPRKTQALGSGFFISEDGYIVTNSHLVADVDQVTITLHDGSEFPATIVGVDKRTDMALLKVTATKKFIPVKWGDSTKARVGDWVIAIGNPFGLSNTVTTGVISSITRDISAKLQGLKVGDYIDGFLQIDASINMGNSGGPTFNTSGEMIGINTAIFSPSGGSIGLGFAVPSSVAKPVIEQLKKYGKTKRGWIGVYIQPITKELAEELKLSTTDGALVGTVPKDGPAASAKILPGDVIISFNGQKVKSDRHLRHAVGEGPIGENVPIKVLRKGKEVELKIKVQEFEDAEAKGLIAGDNIPPAVQQPEGPKVLGMGLQSLTPELKKRFELPEDLKGVVISEIERGSEAVEKGLRPGDVIVEASQIPVSTPEELAKAVESAQKAGRKHVLLQIAHGKMIHHITLSLESDEEEEGEEKKSLLGKILKR